MRPQFLAVLLFSFFSCLIVHLPLDNNRASGKEGEGALAPLASTVFSARPGDEPFSRAMKMHILRCTVKINRFFDAGHGSGVVFTTQQMGNTYYTYVITNAHVVGSAEEINVEHFLYRKNRDIIGSATIKSNILFRDPLIDLALIEVITESPVFNDRAALISNEGLDNLVLNDKACVCGCPYGEPPFCSEGEIVGFNNGGIGLLHITAPIMLGSSGGGAFLNDGRLVAIAVKLAAIWNRVEGMPMDLGVELRCIQLINNGGIFIPIDKVKSFLHRNKADFIFNGSSQEFKGFLEEKEKRKKEKLKIYK